MRCLIKFHIFFPNSQWNSDKVEQLNHKLVHFYGFWDNEMIYFKYTIVACTSLRMWGKNYYFTTRIISAY